MERKRKKPFLTPRAAPPDAGIGACEARESALKPALSGPFPVKFAD